MMNRTRGLNRVLKWTILTLLVGLLAGCGSTIPAIEPALLQQKISLLVMTGPGYPEQADESLTQTLLSWRSKQGITFERWKNVDALGEEQRAAIRSKAYDYVVVVGSQLAGQVVQEANAAPDKRWVLLDDSLRGEGAALALPGNVSHRVVSSDLLETLWDDWVAEQQAAGRVLEWVTTAEYPIPSSWAPSEEAEYVSFADAEGWFPALRSQVARHRPSYLVVYAPLDDAALQQLQSLKVPMINMAAASVQIRWDAVYGTLLGDMLGGGWKAGVKPYGESELSASRTNDEKL